MYFSIVLTSVYYLFEIVASGFEVNQPAEVCELFVGIMEKSDEKVDLNRKFVIIPWLQNGYKIRKKPMYSPKYVDYLDKMRIKSAFYNPKSKPKT